MKKPPVKHVFVLGLLVMAAGQALASDERVLPQFGWSTRPLVVIAPQASSAPLKRTDTWIFRHDAALAERDVTVVHVVGNRVGGLPTGSLQPIDASDLRQKLGVASGDFALVLIGKDGGIKQRSNNPADLTRWLWIIDAMPMRQAGGR